MSTILVIKGIDNDAISVSLKEILACFTDANKYHWKILWLEATGEPKNCSMLELEAKINNSISGYSITFNEVLELSDYLHQIIEILLISDKKTVNLKRYPSDDLARVNCTNYIELVDSSYWEISSKDLDFVGNLKKCFLTDPSDAGFP